MANSLHIIIHVLICALEVWESLVWFLTNLVYMRWQTDHEKHIKGICLNIYDKSSLKTSWKGGTRSTIALYGKAKENVACGYDEN